MLRAIDQAGNLVDAKEVTRAEARHLICPGCRRPVILRRGEQVTAHFAHLSGQNCDYESQAESEEHLRGKLFIYKKLQELNYSVDLEVYVPQIKQRADVMINRAYPVEIQCSPLPFTRLKERNSGYASLGLRPCWILGDRFHFVDHLTSFHKACMTEYNEEASLFFYVDRRETLDLYTNFCSTNRLGKITYHKYRLDKHNQWQMIKCSSPADQSSVENNKQLFARAIHFKEKRIRSFCQLLYQRGQSWLDLPDLFYHTLPSEWMIKSCPEEWKWHFISRFVTAYNRPFSWQAVKWWAEQSRVFEWNYLPLLLRSYTSRPLKEWIKFLEEKGILKAVAPEIWVVKKMVFK